MSEREQITGVSRRTMARAGLAFLATPAILRVIPANAQSRGRQIAGASHPRFWHGRGSG